MDYRGTMKLRQKIRKTLIFISVILFPVTMFYYSPYVIIHAATESVICGSFILFALMLFFSIFFGRIFCGYMCAGAGLGEMSGCINSKPPKLGRLKLIKYVIWVIWIAIVITLYVINGGLKYIDPLYGTEYGISIKAVEEYPVYLIVVFILFLLPLIFGKRATCHYICWMAPFMNIGMKIRNILHLPGLRMAVDQSKCIDCKLCTKNCPMGLDVHHMVKDNHIDEYECSMCGECVDHCPKKVISYKFK